MEFGERCGFYQTYLSRLERGQANPTLNAMEVIANALGLTIYELWDRTRDLQRHPQSGEKQSQPLPVSKRHRMESKTPNVSEGPVSEAQALLEHQQVLKDVAVMKTRIRELTKKEKEGTITRAEERELNKLFTSTTDKLLEGAQRIGNAARKEQ